MSVITNSQRERVIYNEIASIVSHISQINLSLSHKIFFLFFKKVKKMAADDPRLRTSLYVGDLPPEVTEKDLAETFGRVGPLLSVHLCRDKLSRKSLCYAYVNFWFPCHASTALKCLNHTILRGKSMRIMWCQRDPITRKNSIGNLFVKNLHKSITSSRLQEIFSKYGTILSCKDSAMAALNAFHDTVLEGKKLYVSRFLKKIERKDAEPGFRSLYVKNLDEGITEDILKDKFSEQGKVISAVIMKDEKGKSKGFGFVNFDSHEVAKKAMEVLNGKLIGSKNLFVGRAEKKAERMKHFRQINGYNCTNHRKESKASNLYVKNLEASVDDRKLEELFSGYGKVISAKVMRNGDGVSKGFGFVRLSCPDEAKKALNSLIGAEFKGRTLYLALAWQKEQQTRKVQKSYAKFPPQPLYTSTCQPPRCKFPHFSSPIPIKHPSPWHPTLYQNSVRPFSSSNPFQAQNFRGVFCAFIPLKQTLFRNTKDCIKQHLPTQLATSDVYGQDRCAELWKGQKPSSRSQNKINNGDAKELCKGSGENFLHEIISRDSQDKTWSYASPSYSESSASGNGLQLEMTV
ncbi:hypothetical protein Pfo_012173 [Paulownia fortunei]|nr:hypothetical protein Pfo_012173 [Paulownia fortunei]